jgi:hypothetical protein
MTPLTKVGKRLDNITRYILDNNPQDKWVLSNIVPMFLEAIKSSTTIQEEQIIISQLNKLLDNFEFRYNQIFEGKNKIAHQINQNLQELIEKIKKDFNIQEEKSKRDRCLRIADRKFDKPSAYKSGAVVRCRKGDIWKGIKEEQLDESKQVGTIYHYTTFEAGLKILQSNQLKSGEAADSTKQTPVFAISFTRDKRFHDNHVVGFDESSFGYTPQLRFTIDGNKLSNRFSVQPYSQGGAFSKDRKGFEAEERVISDKPFTIPLSDYLISVDMLVEYKKPKKRDYDWDAEYDYETYAPLRAKIVKFTQDKNIPINLVVNKNGDPWPDKIKPKLINKILNWFTIKETDDPQSGKAAPYGSGYAKLKDIIKEILLEDESLRKWFSRKGAPGKEGGWVDCNAPIRKDGKVVGYKPCGRKEGEKRAKYPSCRPTASQCKTPGKGTKWGKTK